MSRKFEFERVGFIGTGNMGSALCEAAVRSDFAPQVRFFLSNRTREKAENLSQRAKAMGGNAEVSTNAEIARECDLIFLGVKPQMMGGLFAEIAPILQKREKKSYTLVTMAAGITCARIREMAKEDCAVIRIMPNTPAKIGAGTIQVCSLGASEEVLTAFHALMSPAGLLDDIPEHLIDAASALSGCGPAFAYMFLEALADGAVACGLPRDKAMLYAARTLSGAAEMVLEEGKHPGALKDAVCSPGGTTIQGVRALEKGGLRSAAMEAVIAAFEKMKEL